MELLRAARDGDEASLRQLVERYRDRVLQRVRDLMGSSVRRWCESADFAQMVLLDFLAESDRLKPENEKELLRWLTAIARHTIIDESRRKRHHGFETHVELSTGTGLSSAVVSSRETAAPLRDIAQREQETRVRELLCRLPDDARRAVELRQFEGMCFREIGRRLQRSENAAQLLHARALRQLGQLMEERP